jgi:hypothetical protein
MENSKEFIIDNNIRITIVIYVFIMLTVIYFKPSLSYDENGNLKQFGIRDNKSNTIFPLWIIAIITAVFSYYLVLFVTKMIK